MFQFWELSNEYPSSGLLRIYSQFLHWCIVSEVEYFSFESSFDLHCIAIACTQLLSRFFRRTFLLKNIIRRVRSINGIIMFCGYVSLVCTQLLQTIYMPMELCKPPMLSCLFNVIADLYLPLGINAVKVRYHYNYIITNRRVLFRAVFSDLRRALHIKGRTIK